VLAALLTAAPLHAQEHERQVVVAPIAGAAPGIAPHGIAGINFGGDGKLYAGSLIGPGIYRIDVTTGMLEEVVGAPLGEADDVAMGPDGSLVWTAFVAGELRVRRPDGTVATLLGDVSQVNPVNFTGEGRLFAGQVGKPDRLIEVDPSGRQPPRTVATDLGGLNAFVDDGRRGAEAGLYVPLAEKGAIGRVNLATGVVTIVADGLGQPVAVKRDSRGGLVTLDWSTGKLTHVNPMTGETQRIAVVTPPLDNLAIGPDDTIYVSRPTDNGIIAVDPFSGRQRPVVQGTLAAPGGLALTTRGDRPVLIVADAYGYRFVDPGNGSAELLPFDLGTGASSAVAVMDDAIVLGYVRRPGVTVLDRATGRVRATYTGFGAPMGVAAHGGTIYVADYGRGEIVKLVPGGTPERAVVAAGLNGPVGLAIDAAGYLVASEALAGTLLRLDPATGEKTAVAQGLSQPEGLALLPDGRIAVAEVGARRLTLIDPASGSRVVVADELAVGQMFTRSPPPVYLPTGVAADADGAIYVVCDADNSILKFTPRDK